MRRARTIYFNDARHYYLFVFEPPMTMEDAYRPVDEVAGTSVDTLVYGVARGDGLFYPTKVGKRFGTDIQPFDSTVYWRVWKNMQSLIDRGHDPLRLLVDRAHAKGMEFIVSFRMGTFEGVQPPDFPGQRGLTDPTNGGAGLADQSARDHQFAVLKELVTDYPIDGLELDFAQHPGGGPPYLRPEDVNEHTDTITQHVKRLSEMVRSRTDRPGAIGARVQPTEQINRSQGIDVKTWLSEDLVDFVVPMMYQYFQLDPDLPIEWIIDAAHDADASVYGFLQPYVRDDHPDPESMDYASAEMMRAAAANMLAKDVDGIYTWFLNWPLGVTERHMLTEMGDPDLTANGDKHYVVRRRTDSAAEMGYDAPLPLEINEVDPNKRHEILFNIADDIEASADRIQSVMLRIRISDMVSTDKVAIEINGRSIADQTCRRGFGGVVRRPPSPHIIEHYSAQWLEFDLTTVRPRQGQNVLSFSLDSRPELLTGGIRIDDVEVVIGYADYPPRSAT